MCVCGGGQCTQLIKNSIVFEELPMSVRDLTVLYFFTMTTRGYVCVWWWVEHTINKEQYCI